jgi:hypothetical protein
MHRLAIIAIIVGVAGLLVGASYRSSAKAETPDLATVKLEGKSIVQWRRLAIHRRVDRDLARSKAGEAVRWGRSLTRDIVGLRRRMALIEARGVLTSPEERNFLCIHGGEGSWTDPNPPYYGGVQMDEQFAKTYGREYWNHYGSPDHWPVSVQLAVAIKASFTRGYWPWPNTARACGLIG